MLPNPIQEAADKFRELPGIGKKSSQKLALDILNLQQSQFNDMLFALDAMRDKIKYCKISGVLSETEISPLLTDTSRKQNQICLVEEPTDIYSIENSNSYFGTYHVLGKLISPLNNVFAEDTRIPQLIDRIMKLTGNNNVEILVFLKEGFDSDTTISYIKESLIKNKVQHKVELSRLAQGLPLYYNADSLDQATVIKAIEHRRVI